MYILFQSIYRSKSSTLRPALLLIIILLNLTSPSAVPAGESSSEQYASLYNPQLLSTISHPDRMPIEAEPAVGLFLAATSQLNNSIFSETIILIIDYGAQGAIGLIINQPAKTKLSTSFPELGNINKIQNMFHTGGPVNSQNITALIRSDSPIPHSRHVIDNIYMISNLSSLKKLVQENYSAEQMRFYSGYAGWWPGQLDREIIRGSWRVIKGDADIIFTEIHSQPGKLEK